MMLKEQRHCECTLLASFMIMALYNYVYIRPDMVAESLYHEDPARILTYPQNCGV